MNTYQALKVKNKKQWDDFYQLAQVVYAQDAVQTLDLRIQTEEELNPQKNPIAAICEFEAFVVYKNGHIAGRAVSIINPELNEKMGKNIGQVGYIEFINDQSVLNTLLNSCAHWLQAKQCEFIWTDTRFSLNYQVGIQTSGFDHKHTFLMLRQPEYYQGLIEAEGFHSIKSLNAYKVDLSDNYQIPEDIRVQAEHLRQQGFTVKNMRRKDVWPCLRHYNNHWNNNFAHIPFSEEELNHLNGSMGLFLDKRFCFIVEKNNQLAGYLFTFPDYNQALKDWKGKFSLSGLLKFIWRYKVTKQVTGLKTAIIGVDNQFSGRKLTSLLNYQLLNIALKNKCQYIERSWILEDNIASIKQAERIGGKLYKTYNIYEAPIEMILKPDLKQAS